MLTVIFQDVDDSTGNDPDKFLEKTAAQQVLDFSYADDTLLPSGECYQLEVYIRTLITTAGKYGLEPNWDKTLHIRVGHAADILTPTGSPIKTVSQAAYLGSLLTDTGSSSKSVGRRI